ncbi:hypothetical protein GCM10027594_12960 [Hymenobacter agri]
MPVVILLHELGHAVPALLFTRAKVTVYLGSYGDRDHSWRVQIGLLEFYWKKWSLNWSGGMCVPSSQNMTSAQRVIMILGGVGVTFVIAAIGFYGALVLDLHGSIKLFMFLLVIFATVTLVTNLVPREHDGMPSDGLALLTLLTGKKLQADFGPTLQNLIARSREVAIDLGYDHISTLHVFLADCTMPYAYSLTSMFFADAEARQTFYEQHRIGTANENVGSLPLTVEFEQALRLTSSTRRHGLSWSLHPCHLFLAAAEVPSSNFYQLAANTPDLQQVLLTYYRPFDELWSR